MGSDQFIRHFFLFLFFSYLCEGRSNFIRLTVHLGKVTQLLPKQGPTLSGTALSGKRMALNASEAIDRITSCLSAVQPFRSRPVP